RLLLEPTRQLERCRRLCTHPELESFQAFKEHPSIERAHARPCRAQESEDLFADAFCIAEHGPADTATLPVEEFRGRMDHQVRTELERPLQRRRTEAVVDCEEDIVLVRELRQRA